MLAPRNSNKNPFPQGVKVDGFERLAKYKFDLIKILMDDQEILKYLKYNSVYPLKENNIDIENEEIIYKYIYPFYKNNETVDEVKNFINVYMLETYPNVRNKSLLKDVHFCIDVMVNDDTQITSNGSRLDILVDKIDKIMNKSRGFGLGQLEIFKIRLITNKTLTGYSMIYKILDFN